MFAYCLNNPVVFKDESGEMCVPVADPIDEPYLLDSADLLIIKYEDIIISVANEFGVDPLTVAGCIYVEQRDNYNLLDTLFDIPMYFLDTSIGVGQVKISTARLLENMGYIEKTGNDRKIAQRLSGDVRYNISCVAAYLRYHQDMWKTTHDISDCPDILGTLYNIGVRPPHGNPHPNSFGQEVEKCRWKIEMLWCYH